MIQSLWRHACVVALALTATLSACTTTANITDVQMSLDPDGDRIRNVFYSDTKEIHCIASASVGRRGATIETLIRQLAQYDFDRREYIETDAVAAYIEESPAPSAEPFTVSVKLTPLGRDGSPDGELPYPVGRFQCEVRLDGELKGVSIFNIDFPPCPTAIIVPTTLCWGFYEEDKVCPYYGESSRDPRTCRCSRLGGWECPL
jgi:hypothetical protein